MNIKPTSKRTKAGIALGALAVSSAGVLTTVSPAGAVGFVEEPENVVVTAPEWNQVNVAWTAPQFGQEPNHYVVHYDVLPYDHDDDPMTPDKDPIPGSMAVSSTARSALITLIGQDDQLPVRVRVCSRFETQEACSPWRQTTTPEKPADEEDDPVSTGPYAPYWTIDAMIIQNYWDWLGRAPRFDELSYWRNSIGFGTTDLDPNWFWFEFDGSLPVDFDVCGEWNPGMFPNASERYEYEYEIMLFLEYMRHDPSVDPVLGPVTRLYQAFFLRNPDYDGLAHWQSGVRGGSWNLWAIADFFSDSGEFQDRYGEFDDAEFVALVYRNVLGRNPDSTGFSYWTRQLQTGTTRGAMMLGFSESAEFKRDTERAVVATEAFFSMLQRVPTVGEYNHISSVPFCVDPDASIARSWVHYLYINMIFHTSEYADRVDTGAPA